MNRLKMMMFFATMFLINSCGSGSNGGQASKIEDNARALIEIPHSLADGTECTPYDLNNNSEVLLNCGTSTIITAVWSQKKGMNLVPTPTVANGVNAQDANKNFLPVSFSDNREILFSLSQLSATDGDEYISYVFDGNRYRRIAAQLTAISRSGEYFAGLEGPGKLVFYKNYEKINLPDVGDSYIVDGVFKINNSGIGVGTISYFDLEYSYQNKFGFLIGSNEFKVLPPSSRPDKNMSTCDYINESGNVLLTELYRDETKNRFEARTKLVSSDYTITTISPSEKDDLEMIPLGLSDSNLIMVGDANFLTDSDNYNGTLIFDPSTGFSLLKERIAVPVESNLTFVMFTLNSRNQTVIGLNSDSNYFLVDVG